jgi:hypothetical protein
MAIPAISGISMINAKTYFGDLAFTNYYQLFITEGWDPNGFPKFLDEQNEVKNISSSKGEFIYRGIGSYCVLKLSFPLLHMQHQKSRIISWE